MLKKCLPLLALAWLPVAIHAEALSAKAPAQEPTRIRFQIEAQEKVAGNQMQATLRLEAKHKQPATAARDLNLKLQEAMQKLRTDKRIKTETSQYNTTQLYDEKGRPKEWQVSVDLTLCSEQWSLLNDIIGQLQSKGWLFSGVSFEVSPEQKKTIEAKLTHKAVEEWSEQAQQLAKQLQLKQWKIGHLDISRQGGIQPPPRIEAYRGKMMSASVGAVAPDMAGTDTLLNVTVSGELVAE